MRVALLIDTLTSGGAEAVVQRLALGLARRRHTAFVYILKEAGVPIEPLRAGGVAVREFKSRGRDPLLAWRLLRSMWRDRIDVANAHNSTALCWALPPAKALGIPLIQTRHGALLEEPTFYQRCAARILPLIDRVTIVAEALRSQIPSPATARRAVYVPNGVDCEPVPPEEAHDYLQRLCERSTGGQATGGMRRLGRPVVLSVGTISPEKDPLTLLRAFALLHGRMPDAHLVLVGDTRGAAYGEKVRSEVRALGNVAFAPGATGGLPTSAFPFTGRPVSPAPHAGRLEECVHWLGEVPDAYRLMAGADVFCQSSATEAMPMTILEAMSQRVPIVATAVGDVGCIGNTRGTGLRPVSTSATTRTLLRHPETALLVPPRDPRALAEALHYTLAEPAAAQARAARAAADYARSYTAEQMVRRYEHVYADCLRRGATGGLSTSAFPFTGRPGSPGPRAGRRNVASGPRAGRRMRAVTTRASHRCCPQPRPGVLMVGPARGQIGGIVSVIDALLASPLRERFQLHHFAPPGRPAPREGEAPAEPDRSLTRLRGALEAVRRHAHALWQLARTIERKDVAIVHIHTCSFLSFYRNVLDLAVARGLRRRVCLHIHGGKFGEFCAGSGPPGRRLIRHACQAADAVIVLSDTWERSLRPHLGRSRLIVIANGVPVSPQATVHPDRACRFLFLGKLCQQKGVAELIAAAEQLRDAGVAFELILAGPLAESDDMHYQECVRARGLQTHVHFVGPVLGAVKADLLASADCLVLPSYSEGLPIVILEAAAVGLAVLATPVGAIPEFMTADAPDDASPDPRFIAPLVPPGDSAALAKEMSRLAADPALRRAIGAKLRARLSAGYTLDRQAHRIAEVYDQILPRSRGWCAFLQTDRDSPDSEVRRYSSTAAPARNETPSGRLSAVMEPGTGGQATSGTRSSPAAARM